MTLGSKLLSGSVLAVIGLITVKVVLALVGAVVGFVSFMLFTVLPIAIGVWLVVKLFRYVTRDPVEAA